MTVLEGLAFWAIMWGVVALGLAAFDGLRGGE